MNVLSRSQLTSAIPSSLVLVAVCIWMLTLPDVALLRFFPDDAFFYLQAAFHVGSGSGVTFDGINPTNGFHPLYLMLLSAISWVFPLQGGTGLRAVVIFDTALTVIWFFVAARLAAAFGYSRSLSFGFLALLLPIAFNQDFGTEANLLLPLAWGFILAAYRLDERHGPALLAGILGALTCLARLDTILLVFAVSAAVIARPLFANRVSLLRSVMRGLFLVGPSLIALGAFAQYNKVVHGHSSTISSWLKFGWRQIEMDEGVPLYPIDPHHTALIGGLVLASVAIGRLIIHRSNRNLIVPALGTWLIAYTVVMTLMLRGGMQFWYFTLPFSVIALILADLGQPLLRKASENVERLFAAAVFVFAVAASILGAKYWLSRGWATDTALQMAHWTNHNLPPDTPIFQVDQSGIIGYFSKQPIINGDGLVNGWDYQRMLRAGMLREYFEQNEINHVIWDGYYGEDVLGVPVALWSDPNLIMGFEGEEIELVRFGGFQLFKVDPANLTLTPSR